MSDLVSQRAGSVDWAESDSSAGGRGAWSAVQLLVEPLEELDHRYNVFPTPDVVSVDRPDYDSAEFWFFEPNKLDSFGIFASSSSCFRFLSTAACRFWLPLK